MAMYRATNKPMTLPTSAGLVDREKEEFIRQAKYLKAKE